MSGDDEPLAEARMISAVCGKHPSGMRLRPNGRVVGSPFYEAKLAWFDRLARWLSETIRRRCAGRSWR
jgi:exodeoxyribonuclease-3